MEGALHEDVSCVRTEEALGAEVQEASIMCSWKGESNGKKEREAGIKGKHHV